MLFDYSYHYTLYVFILQDNNSQYELRNSLALIHNINRVSCRSRGSIWQQGKTGVLPDGEKVCNNSF
jgi:hypothetical protein